MDNEPTHEFEGSVIRETDKAWLFYMLETDEEVWFPKSQCRLDPAGQMITVPEWLVRAKDL